MTSRPSKKRSWKHARWTYHRVFLHPHLEHFVSTLPVSVGLYHNENRADWYLVALIIFPYLEFQNFGCHGLNIFLGVVFADGSKDENAFAYGGDEIAVNGNRCGFDPLQNGYLCL